MTGKTAIQTAVKYANAACNSSLEVDERVIVFTGVEATSFHVLTNVAKALNVCHLRCEVEWTKEHKLTIYAARREDKQ